MWWSKFVLGLMGMWLLSLCGSNSKETLYPFSKAVRIEAISYVEGRESWEGKDYSRYISDGKIAFEESKIRERVDLIEEQEIELYQFLFEDDCPFYGSVARCYDPRHMILFYDKDDKIFDYFEVCLECGGSQANFQHNDVCIERTDDIKGILEKAGIKHFE